MHVTTTLEKKKKGTLKLLAIVPGSLCDTTIATEMTAVEYLFQQCFWLFFLSNHDCTVVISHETITHGIKIINRAASM